MTNVEDWSDEQDARVRELVAQEQAAERRAVAMKAESLPTCALVYLSTEEGWCCDGIGDDFDAEREVYADIIRERGGHPGACPECAALAAHGRRQVTRAALAGSEVLTIWSASEMFGEVGAS